MHIRPPASIGARAAAGLLVLSAVALAGAGATYHAMKVQAALIAEIGHAARGPLLVERLRAGVYATVMESRGLYLAKDRQQAVRFASNLRGDLANVQSDWQQLIEVLPGAKKDSIATLGARVAEFIKLRTELARVGVEEGSKAADSLGNNEASRNLREAFSRGLDQLARETAEAVNQLQLHTLESGRRAAIAVLSTTVLAVVVTLALVLWLTQKTIARPLRRVTQALETIAQGTLDGIALPDAGRGEVGDIARATKVVLARLRRNREVEAAAAQEHQVRDRRQQQMDIESRRFGETVSGVMNLLRKAATDMRRTITEMADAITRTSEDAASTATGAEQSAGNLTEVATATTAMTASVGEISRAARWAPCAASARPFYIWIPPHRPLQPPWKNRRPR